MVHQVPDIPKLPQGFLSPEQFHEGQWAAFTSRSRITAMVAGQGGGKTSCWYWRLYALMRAYPGESHFVGFPSYKLLDRVIINPVDADRYTLVQFLEIMGENPSLHKLSGWIECKSGQILFASAENLVNFEGSHVISATIDEFDECPVGVFKRVMERTRLKRGYVTLAGTPRHVRWVRQELMHRNDEGKWVPNDNVTMIQFPSTANPKYSSEAMEEAKGSMAGFEYRRMHLGELAEAEGGNLFRREWWQFSEDTPQAFESIIQVWDTAFKAKTTNDYSVCATWGKGSDGKLYVLDVVRKKLEWPDLVQEANRLYQIWRPHTVRIEDKASGQSLIQELRTKGLPVVAVKADQDKWRRASSVTGLVEAGHVHLMSGTPWVNDFIEEHAQFSPDDSHDYDDQVDTTAMALAYFKQGLISGGGSRIIGERKDTSWRNHGSSNNSRGNSGRGNSNEGAGGRIISGKGKSRWR